MRRRRSAARVRYGSSVGRGPRRAKTPGRAGMARRMASAFSGEKSTVWSKVKVVATGRIVDADFFRRIFAIFLGCGGGVVFRCFTGGFGESWR